MDKIKQAKLIELRNKKNINNKKADLARHTELIESINKLHSLFEDNGSTNTDKLLNKLEEFSVFKSDVLSIKEAITNLNRDNVSINNFAELIESQSNIDFTQVINAINQLTEVVKANTVDSVTIKNRDTSEYIPVRRVRQVQNRLVFDDDPLQVTVVGGGGGSGGLTMLPFKDSTGKSVQVTVTEDGKLPVDAGSMSQDIRMTFTDDDELRTSNVPDTRFNFTDNDELKVFGNKVGDLINFNYDSVYASYPDQLTEVYTYKLNSNTVGTITVTYLAIDKKELASCVRS